MQAACGINDDQIMAMIAGEFQSFPRNLNRIALAHLKDPCTGSFADDLQLFNCGGTVNVTGNQQRPAAFFILEVFCQFGGVGGFTTALKAAHQNDGRRLGSKFNPGIFAAHQRGQFLIDNLDDLLGRGQTFEDLCTDSPFTDGFDKVLDDLVVDVRFQKRQLDFTHRVLDVRFAQLTFGTQLFKGRRKLV